MFLNKYDAEDLITMNEATFSELYNGKENQDFLSYIEIRMRMELVNLIRVLDRKGEIFIEVRKKTSISAYNKVRKEVRRFESDSQISLTELVKDFIGCRIICMDENVLSGVFRSILESEILTIQDDGFELYSAPFRKYEVRQDRYSRLIGSLGLKDADRKPEDAIKKTNYESLHCYIQFSSPYDLYDKIGPHTRLEIHDEDQYKDNATIKELDRISKKISSKHRSLIKSFPVECQIRTISEHLWAHEEHKYVYEQVKTGSIAENDPKIELLRDVFTALKHAYGSIDDMRGMVRNISTGEEHPLPVFKGSSKDVSECRLRFFKSEDLKANLVIIDQRYREYIEDGNNDPKAISKIYSDIADSYRALNSKRSFKKSFVTEIWGQDRLYYALVAYILLTSRVTELSDELITLFESIGLDKFIGRANLKIAQIQENSGIILAGRIYTAIISYDQFTYHTNEKLDPEMRVVFKDPLIFVRYASSLFLQGRFAEAFDTLETILYDQSWVDFRSNKSPYSGEFSLFELFMRKNQYAWFRNYGETERLSENISEYKLDVERIFSDEIYCDDSEGLEKFRAYCWFIATISVLDSKNVVLPTSYKSYSEKSVNFVSEKVDNFKGKDAIWDKPEVICAFYMNSELKQKSVYPSDFSPLSAIRKNANYPSVSKAIITNMLKVVERNVEKEQSHDMPKVFVSYSHSDVSVVSQIMEFMSRSGIHVLSDKDFEAGDSLVSGMEAAISEADICLIILTESYVQSAGWLKKEREAIISKDAIQSGCYIPVSVNLSYEIIRSRFPMLANDLIVKIESTKVRYQVHSLISKILKMHS